MFSGFETRVFSRSASSVIFFVISCFVSQVLFSKFSASVIFVLKAFIDSGVFQFMFTFFSSAILFLSLVFSASSSVFVVFSTDGVTVVVEFVVPQFWASCQFVYLLSPASIITLAVVVLFTWFSCSYIVYGFFVSGSLGRVDIVPFNSFRAPVQKTVFHS